ncbi:hypothetical protein GGR58DRAFT_473760 [Xylaria digitata]|nr:hypothetical protein GGR58DRAFT_473760 [Xylaria digitata]
MGVTAHAVVGQLCLFWCFLFCFVFCVGSIWPKSICSLRYPSCPSIYATTKYGRKIGLRRRIRNNIAALGYPHRGRKGGYNFVLLLHAAFTG